MQKVYQRINWENDPSTKTAINEDNLNKMDYALDQIDNRVVALSGYQDRVAQAEKNAKTSETNAKASETNAKQSELKAKEYMENAFNGTPEGYEALITKVDLLDIKKTTSSTLQNSKHGGARLTKVVGNTEQKKLSGKNLWEYGDQTFGHKSEKSVYLPKGTYTFSAIITSDDTSASVCRVFFFDSSGGTVKYVDLPRNSRTSATVTLDNDVASVRLYSSSYDGASQGKNATYKNIQIEKGSTMSEYEPYLGGVELIQGYYVYNTGVYISSDNAVCSKNKTLCKSGDKIKLKTESAYNLCVIFFSNGAYVDNRSASGVTELEYTIPSGNIDSFLFYAGNGENALSPQTVGKVSLTVNGKPIYVHSGAYDGGMTSPSPYYPQSMYHTSDCVEIVQGSFTNGTGVYDSKYARYVSNKYPIPCKSGDVLSVELEKGTDFYIYYYNDNGFIKNAKMNSSDNTKYSFTIPSDISPTKFNFSIGKDGGDVLTPDTVGKITLQINGKYVNCIREHGKNHFDMKQLLQASGWAENNGVYSGAISNLKNRFVGGFDLPKFKENTVYTISLYGYASESEKTPRIGFFYTDGTEDRFNISATSMTKYEATSDVGKTIKYVYFTYGTGGSSTVYLKDIQIEESTVATPFEEYQENVAYFLTEKPMMADSVLFNENGLFKVEHGRTEVVFNGTESGWAYSKTLENGVCRFATSILSSVADFSDIRGILSDKFTPTKDSDNAYNCRFSTDGTFFMFVPIDVLTEVSAPAFRTWLAENETLVQYKLATPYIEVLDTESQLALNGLKTFDNVTYLDFDSRVKPKEIEVEYGTSQVGAYTLQSLNNTEANAIRLNELAVAMVSLGSEV